MCYVKMSLQLPIFVFFCLLSYSLSAQLKDEDYEAALNNLSNSYHWAYEELVTRQPVSKMHKIQEINLIMSGARPAVVGLRGMEPGMKFTDNQCMGIMVRENVVATLCACVFSWYLTYSVKPPRDPVIPARGRNEKFDLLADDLFVYFPKADNTTVYMRLTKPPYVGQNCEGIYKYGDSEIMNLTAIFLQVDGATNFEGNWPDCTHKPSGGKTVVFIHSYGFTCKNCGVEIAAADNTSVFLPNQLLSNSATRLDCLPNSYVPKACDKPWAPDCKLSVSDSYCYNQVGEFCAGYAGAPVCTDTVNGETCCFALMPFPISCERETGNDVPVILLVKMPEFVKYFDYEFQFKKDVQDDLSYANYEDEIAPDLLPDLIPIKQSIAGHVECEFLLYTVLPTVFYYLV